MKVKQFQEVYKICKEEPDEIIRAAKACAVIHGKDFQHYLNNMTPRELIKYIPDFKMPEGKARTRLAGYYVNTLVSEIKGADFIDLTELTKSEESIMENIHNIVAIFCKTRWLRKRTREQIANDILKQPIESVYPLAVFFCNLLMVFLERMKVSLQKEELKQLKEQQKALKEALASLGGGSSR